jgi:hypothetical protein
MVQIQESSRMENAAVESGVIPYGRDCETEVRFRRMIHVGSLADHNLLFSSHD